MGVKWTDLHLESLNYTPVESNQQQGLPHSLQRRPLSTCVGYTHLKHDKGSNERLTGSNTTTTEAVHVVQVPDVSCEVTPTVTATLGRPCACHLFGLQYLI